MPHLTRLATPGALLCAALAALPAGAAETGAAVAAPVGVGRLLQTMLGLALVLAVIVAVSWVLRRVLRLQPDPGGRMRVVAGLSLGTRERVVLLDVGGRQILLGVGPGRVHALHVFDQPVLEADDAARPPSGFPDQLRAVLGRGR